MGNEEKRPGWVSGRLKESVDGLSGRPQTAQQQQRLREAADREARSASHAHDEDSREKGRDA
jgi:hypothetical protein